MIPRRDLLEGLFKTGMAAVGSRVVGNPKDRTSAGGSVTEHALPSIPLEHWTLTVVEMNYPAGSCTCPRIRQGFVVGYVLQGEIRFSAQGKADQTYHAGQVFYEPPDSLHELSVNTSSQHPARLVVLRFAKPDNEKDHSA
jgi:quercetin dioxygenase-like cupin family protein